MQALQKSYKTGDAAMVRRIPLAELFARRHNLFRVLCSTDDLIQNLFQYLCQLYGGLVTLTSADTAEGAFQVRAFLRSDTL